MYAGLFTPLLYIQTFMKPTNVLQDQGSYSRTFICHFWFDHIHIWEIL